LALGLRRGVREEYVLRNLIGPSLYQFQKLILNSVFTTHSESERGNYLEKAYEVLIRFLKEARSQLEQTLG